LPSMIDPPAVCRFSPRCDHAVEECRSGEQPPMVPTNGTEHRASCVYYQSGYDATELRREAERATAVSDESSARTDGGSR